MTIQKSKDPQLKRQLEPNKHLMQLVPKQHLMQLVPKLPAATAQTRPKMVRVIKEVVFHQWTTLMPNSLKDSVQNLLPVVPVVFKESADSSKSRTTIEVDFCHWKNSKRLCTTSVLALNPRTLNDCLKSSTLQEMDKSAMMNSWEEFAGKWTISERASAWKPSRSWTLMALVFSRSMTSAKSTTPKCAPTSSTERKPKMKFCLNSLTPSNVTINKVERKITKLPQTSG